eukprot:CAMPEP_0168314728 /NCGR_PEP_ID=MMETSP0210-20121227/9362_1 /TAXON_ID=40633 /ORGANISM="Condylostoma magnum, Strain COL2" /LENGTH=90 /DNA_ID=CAMNT_0008284837 /DNA_START=1911 /DNA_END=2183 /DNA_ORIENTATION=+
MASSELQGHALVAAQKLDPEEVHRISTMGAVEILAMNLRSVKNRRLEWALYSMMGGSGVDDDEYIRMRDQLDELHEDNRALLEDNTMLRS